MCYDRASQFRHGISLQWRHNGPDRVSNHQPHQCLLNRLFRRRSKKTSKLRVTGLCAGNSPETGEFPAQMASNAKKVSIWWHHHVYLLNCHGILRNLVCSFQWSILRNLIRGFEWCLFGQRNITRSHRERVKLRNVATICNHHCSYKHCG